MKLKYPVVLMLLMGTFILFSGIAHAEELKGKVGSLNALGSGYAITRWPPSDGMFFVGEDLTVRACTTETDADSVVFRWNLPDGSSFDTDPKPLNDLGDTWDGATIYENSDTQTLTMFGDYGVQALFIDSDGKLQGPNPYPVVQIKAISGHAVPELPLGTITAILAMVGALGIFAIKKKGFVPKI